MSKNLEQLQKQFADDIVNLSIVDNIYSDSINFTSKELIGVYHNNYLLTLIDVLKSSYSCIFRLVGDDFFTYIAKKYIIKYPQKQGYLQNYGNDFADFIATIKECKNMPYLSDIALLEKYYELCYHSKNIDIDFDFSKLTAVFTKNNFTTIIDKCYLLSSKYPILAIWRLNDNSAKLNLDSGGNNILIYKYNDKVLVVNLSEEDYEFLNNLNS